MSDDLHERHAKAHPDRRVGCFLCDERATARVESPSTTGTCDRHSEAGAYNPLTGYFVHDSDGANCDSTFVIGPRRFTLTAEERLRLISRLWAVETNKGHQFVHPDLVPEMRILLNGYTHPDELPED